MMFKRMRKKEVERFLQEMREASVAPVVIWLEDHFEEMRALAAEHRVAWSTLVKRLDSLGIRNRDGTPLRPASVRATWARVRRRMKQPADAVS